jgi:hypothetical protein
MNEYVFSIIRFNKIYEIIIETWSIMINHYKVSYNYIHISSACLEFI